MMPTPTIGERLRSFREAAGLSQKEAASRAGISQASWCDYENDEKLPRVRQAIAIAKLTQRSPFRVRLLDIAEAEKVREDDRRGDASDHRKTA